MASRREKWADRLVKKNPSVEAFLALLAKQRAAVAAEKFTNRSWAKKDGDSFLVTIGELGLQYRLESSDEILTLFDDIKADTQDDAELIEQIEAAYGVDTGVEPEVKKTRKKRAVRLDD